MSTDSHILTTPPCRRELLLVATAIHKITAPASKKPACAFSAVPPTPWLTAQANPIPPAIQHASVKASTPHIAHLNNLGRGSINVDMKTSAVLTIPNAPRKAANSSQDLRSLQAEEVDGHEEMLSWRTEAESGTVVPARSSYEGFVRMGAENFEGG